MNHLDSAFGADVAQTASAQLRRKKTREAQIHAFEAHECAHRRRRLERRLGWVDGRIRKQRQGVKILDDEPAAGLERPNELIDDGFSFGQVAQQKPRVNEIEACLWQSITDNIVTPDGKIWC